MGRLDLGAVLRSVVGADPASIPDLLLSFANELGASDVVVYLVDYAQTTLEPLPDRNLHAEVPSSEEVAVTLAGRAFLDQKTTTADRPDGVRVWVPVVEGSDRTGVLALTLAAAGDAAVEACEELGMLAGYLIATHARATDLYNLYRRRKPLSLAASMQWDLLPPLVLKTARLDVAASIEPAYDIGGDCFDYAINDVVFDLAVMDALGHGVPSALIAALTVGSYRHDRRQGHTLDQMHTNLEGAMTRQYSRSAFSTGQLARFDLQTGAMTWTNAGHPLPLLIRGGKVVGELTCPPTLPWGLGSLMTPVVGPTLATEALEPWDCVLFYTDGVIEAHDGGGELFGVERLADLAGRTASDQLEPEEIVRRLVRSVIEHQSDTLVDDATLVLVRWHGPDNP